MPLRRPADQRADRQIFGLAAHQHIQPDRCRVARPWAWMIAVVVAALIGINTPASAQTSSPPAAMAASADDGAAPAPHRSALDALMFYQLLIGEMELRSGQAGVAFEVLLDAARRSRDEQLFRRAVDVALQGRVGDQALVATKAWRAALPESLDALRTQLQILVALNRINDVGEPLRALLARTPDAERGGLISSVPRFLQRAGEARVVAGLIEEQLQPYAGAASTKVAARVAIGRAWLAAGDTDKALTLARAAASDDAAAAGPALLAMDLMGRQPAAEELVSTHLRQPRAEPAVRLAYVRVLVQAQRHADAIKQLEIATALQPELAAPWLTLGALHVELKHPPQADAALLRYVDLVTAAGAGGPLAAGTAAAAPVPADKDDEDDQEVAATSDAAADTRGAGLVQAWLLLAQSAELRGDFAAVEKYLARVDSPQRALEVQSRRAAILARQGRLREARELLQKLPERQPDDARAKLVAEAHLLRELKRWSDSHAVLAAASQRWPDDTELVYEQAMMAEKLDRVDEMERLLRRVIAAKPDHQHAYNALGYSLADRGQRLPEARALIAKALELAPGDPFITDSLGWVEYRLGNRDEALRLLRQAYASRPDTEIAAHLGEVLWASGQQDEARRVWREGRSRDAANEVLRETLARLKPDL
jgi:tetratricopeptide (TPR) repeat protein